MGYDRVDNRRFKLTAVIKLISKRTAVSVRGEGISYTTTSGMRLGSRKVCTHVLVWRKATL